MVTNTNKQDISEFFLWSDYSPLTPGERLQSWNLGIRPHSQPCPPKWAGWGQAHLEQLALFGSLWLCDGENVEMREPLPLPSPLVGWAGALGVNGVGRVAMAVVGE